jgi:hypothetical protein
VIECCLWFVSPLIPKSVVMVIAMVHVMVVLVMVCIHHGVQGTFHLCVPGAVLRVLASHTLLQGDIQAS